MVKSYPVAIIISASIVFASLLLIFALWRGFVAFSSPSQDDGKDSSVARAGSIAHALYPGLSVLDGEAKGQLSHCLMLSLRQRLAATGVREKRSTPHLYDSEILYSAAVLCLNKTLAPMISSTSLSDGTAIPLSSEAVLNLEQRFQGPL